MCGVVDFGTGGGIEVSQKNSHFILFTHILRRMMAMVQPGDSWAAKWQGCSEYCVLLS